MSPQLEQESIEALELALFKLTFKESQGEILSPAERRSRLNLINTLKRLRREAATTTVHSS